ncbi:hypothetical protein [Streptomyces plumbiresistens]|uniref:Uncharacterized protein n=1 Tax=Streptomyces plumbiresistens TaxID=511811 RepID=A0ABP7TQ13_9ACTN
MDHRPARRSELDALVEQLTKQLQEVEVERDELAIAERVLNRLAEQAQADAEAADFFAPVPVKVAGRAVLLIPHHSDAADEGALPGDYRKILAIVREADGPVHIRAVGERLGLDASVRGNYGQGLPLPVVHGPSQDDEGRLAHSHGSAHCRCRWTDRLRHCPVRRLTLFRRLQVTDTPAALEQRGCRMLD